MEIPIAPNMGLRLRLLGWRSVGPVTYGLLWRSPEGTVRFSSGTVSLSALDAWNEFAIPAPGGALLGVSLSMGSGSLEDQIYGDVTLVNLQTTPQTVILPLVSGWIGRNGNPAWPTGVVGQDDPPWSQVQLIDATAGGIGNPWQFSLTNFQWELHNAFWELTTDATVVNRVGRLRSISALAVVVQTVYAAQVQAASLTRAYQFGPGQTVFTALVDTIQVSGPVLVIRPLDTLQVGCSSQQAGDSVTKALIGVRARPFFGV